MPGSFLPRESVSLSCDVLVVGTGAGGASVAATLARAGIDVLMLEEGPYVPADAAPSGLSQSMPIMWRGAGLTMAVGSPPIAFAEGRCVGGGTEINSAIFQRAPDEILQDWARANRIVDFSPELIAPFFNRAAQTVNASLTAGDPGPPTAILERAGRTMGWEVTPLERARCEGPATHHRVSGFASGMKQSMTATLLPQAFGHGARLIAKCRVKQLVKCGTRVVKAIADTTDDQGQRQRLTVSASTVFLCAGTTQTPALLQRSGLGRNVGRNFQLHPTIRVLAEFPERVDAHCHHLPLVAITEFKPDLRLGGSVFTLATFGLGLAEDWATRSSWLADYAHYAMYYAMIRPDGVGRIRSLPGLAEPIVSYRLTERDWRQLGIGLRRLAQALITAGATKVVPSIRGHRGWRTLAELDRDSPDTLPHGRTALMSIHLFGSCPMGEDSQWYPVDSYGRLVAAENVLVADGSVLPGAPGVNPQATIMALAFRSAEAYVDRR